jgi:hypothetical protein
MPLGELGPRLVERHIHEGGLAAVEHQGLDPLVVLRQRAEGEHPRGRIEPHLVALHLRPHDRVVEPPAGKHRRAAVLGCQQDRDLSRNAHFGQERDHERRLVLAIPPQILEHF